MHIKGSDPDLCTRGEGAQLDVEVRACACRDDDFDGGEALAGRAVAIDAPIGKGHVVMFANRPYWRWQTQGSFFLGFNAILNWNHLGAK